MDIHNAPSQDDLNGSLRNRSRASVRKVLFFILVGVIVLAASSQTPGFAQQGEPPHGPGGGTLPRQGREVNPPRRGADLVAAAQAQGPMRVIVELNVRFVPEGDLINPDVETVATSAAVRAQRSSIANVKAKARPPECSCLISALRRTGQACRASPP